MEKKKMAKALVLTAAVASGISLLAPTYSEAQASVKKYVWCQSKFGWYECNPYGTGLTCTTGQKCN